MLQAGLCRRDLLLFQRAPPEKNYLLAELLLQTGADRFRIKLTMNNYQLTKVTRFVVTVLRTISIRFLYQTPARFWALFESIFPTGIVPP